MKLVCILETDEGWVDEPSLAHVYIFNNMRECFIKLNQLGYCVEIIEEPSPTKSFHYGMIKVSDFHHVYNYKVAYSQI